MTILAVNETKVEYNRSPRRWQLSGKGSQADLPPGPEGKRAAQLEALRRDCPDVAADIEQVLAQTASQPQAEAIARRLIKAGFLVRDGYIEPPLPLEEPSSYVHEIARVRSRRDPAVAYAICFTPERQAYCECLDWHNGHQLDILAEYYREHPADPQRPKWGAPKLSNGDYACQHILAVRLRAAQRLREERQSRQQSWEEHIERQVDEALYGPDPALRLGSGQALRLGSGQALLTVESLGWVDEQLPDAEEVA
jgi:hypothetical protein